MFNGWHYLLMDHCILPSERKIEGERDRHFLLLLIIVLGTQGEVIENECIYMYIENNNVVSFSGDLRESSEHCFMNLERFNCP